MQLSTPILTRRAGRCAAGVLTALALAGALAACSGPRTGRSAATARSAAPLLTSSAPSSAARVSTAAAPATTSAEPAGQFTVALAGDVHFAERTAQRLAADPATAFGPAAAQLAAADLTMVNLETAIAVGGTPQPKSFTFQAPPSAFTALRDAGVDVVTMANNHGADYGSDGLRQSLAAIRSSHFPVVGIGADADAAYAPYRTTVNGTRLAILAASQVQDETLANFSAGPGRPGIANAYSDRLVTAVRAARAQADVVLIYVHWGTEYQSCPNADQRTLADTLVAAGATAVVGTHAHVLQGAGWRPDGHYVAYGLGNYFWWRSFGNAQDDNGVLTLTFAHSRVTAARFAPSQLDDRGIGVPATGANRQRIADEWQQLRQCTGLAGAPPVG